MRNCRACGRHQTLTPTMDLTTDNIIPHSRGTDAHAHRSPRFFHKFRSRSIPPAASTVRARVRRDFAAVGKAPEKSQYQIDKTRFPETLPRPPLPAARPERRRHVPLPLRFENTLSILPLRSRVRQNEAWDKRATAAAKGRQGEERHFALKKFLWYNLFIKNRKEHIYG